MLNIWSWNVNGRYIWDRLVSNEVDVALLQEVPLPPADWADRVVPNPTVQWETAGWLARRRTAIVAVSDLVSIVPQPLTSLDEREQGAIKVSRRGTLAVADIVVSGEVITLVSMYAAWDAPVKGRRPIFADAAAHRLLSDLSDLVTSRNAHTIIAAGDLNILNRYGENGHPYWGARYATVFDRAEAMGLRFVGPQAPLGRQADPRPNELPEGSLDVPTYYTARQGPMGATRQLDFVFASHALTDRLTVRALNFSGDEWGPSDHCRVAIELLT